MKLFVIIVSVLLVSILVAALVFRTVSLNLLHYLWWRATSDVVAVHASVRSKDADIHYSVIGQGVPLLLLHGGLSNRLSWFSQLPRLVDDGYQIILVDSRGHGRSELGKDELSYRQLAADAINVLEQLAIDCIDIVGWSDGANTTLLMARFWPQRVARIVAISGNYDPSGLTPEARENNVTSSSGISYWLYRFWTGAGERLSELEQKIKKLWQRGPKLKPDDLRKITASVLIIQGEHDVVTPEHAQTMANLIPDCRLAIIPGGGHATPITQPGQINRLIEEFLPLSFDQVRSR